MANTTYPGINALSLKDAREGLKLARMNYDSLTPEGQADLLPRITALEARILRLNKTQGMIDRATLALGSKARGGVR